MSNGCDLRTVAVLGGSYGGSRAAQVLAASLPSGWRVVLVDRNSHFNHVYNLPRYSVLPGHEHKAFIPYDHLFSNPADRFVSHPHTCVHGTITSIHPHHITYRPHGEASHLGPPAETTEEQVLYFDYAIYALGSHLPLPINLWESDMDSSYKTQESAYTGTKKESVSCLRSRQWEVETAKQVLVVGGGALGIQFASDIAAVYPHKSVTLLHSRSRLLPRFDEALGDEAYQCLEELGVHVIFGERLDMLSLEAAKTKCFGGRETISVKTTKGREIKADLVLLCTGQIPNTSLLHAMDPRTIDPSSGMIRVSRTMQILALGEQDITFDQGSTVCSNSPALYGTIPSSPVDTLVELDFNPPDQIADNVSMRGTVMESDVDMSYEPATFVYPHLFAIGDAADAFGAINAGHTAYYQGEVAARNVIKLIKSNTSTVDAPLQGLAMTLGALGTRKVLPGSKGDLELEEYEPGPPMIKVSLGLTKSAYEVAGVVGTKSDGKDDLGAAAVWGLLGHRDIDEEGMWA